MAPVNYNSANKINGEMPLKFEIKHEPMDDDSLNNTVETLFKGNSNEIVCKDSNVDISYNTKLAKKEDMIEKEINFKSASKNTQEMTLKIEFKDEPTIDNNSSNAIECANSTVETLFKRDGGEFVCEDTKIDFSSYTKLDGNIGKEKHFNSVIYINQEMPLKLDIKDEPTDNNFLYPTECADDTKETLYKPDDSEICSKNSKIDDDHTPGNNISECLGKSEEGKKDIAVNYETPKKATEKKYMCDICNNSFTRSFTLKIHMRIHTGEKPYRCDVCNKCFSDSSKLSKHKRTHTDEKPYRCDICNKCFSQPNNLNYHKRTHTGEKPYKCDVCNKCFPISGTLISHKRTHTGEKPYQCDICDMCFSISSNLICHKRTHTGEKPYKCDVCNKCFSRLSSLNFHKRTHTGEKPYQCDVCNKCFRKADTLNRHKCTPTIENRETI